nr:S8 family serine peptidase [Streptomyces sp. B1I3]
MTVAVIDTGVREVPELAGQLLAGKDFTDGVVGEHDEGGTTAAAAIAGTGKGAGGEESVYGLAPGAKILPLKVSDGSEAPDSLLRSITINNALAPAIRYAADSEAKVITVSVAARQGSAVVAEAVKYALSRGKLVFAAVGENASGRGEVQNPAVVPGVVGVASVGEDLAASAYSTRGPEVDLSAPGEDVLSACAEKAGTCRSSGSAVASAIAAASAALIWAEHPNWTNYQVMRVMVNTAGGPTSGAVRNDYIGYGVVRPRIALQTPGDPGPADSYPLPDFTDAPAPQSGGATGGEKAIPVAADNRHHAFVISLGVTGVGLLCLALSVPLLMADRRRVGRNLSGP